MGAEEQTCTSAAPPSAALWKAGTNGLVPFCEAIAHCMGLGCTSGWLCRPASAARPPLVSVTGNRHIFTYRSLFTQFFAQVEGKRLKCWRLLRPYPADLDDPTAATGDSALEVKGMVMILI